LIIARPDRHRDSLVTLLKTMPSIHILAPVDNGASALRAVTEDRPDVVVLDVNVLNGQTWGLLRQLSQRCVLARYLVLVDSFGQQAVARANGIDVALVKGFSTTELFSNVQNLMSDRKTRCEERAE
jgi:DNA-binding NarL/FixJ family response regulator